MTDIAALNHAEQVALEECERVIGGGLKSFIETGSALTFVRDNRLYRAMHSTFEAYARERWNLTPQHANRLALAAGVVTSMEPMGSIPPPTSERQARELAKVPEPERAEVWRETVERTDGKPTAAAIREVHEERTRPPSPGPADTTTPPADPGATPAPAVESPTAPVEPREPGPPAIDDVHRRELEDELARDSERRAQVRNLTSVLTYLVPRAITPAELAARSYAPVLDEFKQDDLDLAAETMAAIAALKRGM